MNVLLDLPRLNRNSNVGIYSACSANEYVIKAVLLNAKRHNTIAVIEATANQCNQFGGYTGMTPLDFRNYVYNISQEVGFDTDKIVLGGDHLGPLTWVDIDVSDAMKNASQLIYDYVYAGYTKIHIDTSMKLKGDLELTDEVISERSAILAKSALKAYEDLKQRDNKAIFPVFIIGSEVPIPGGSQEQEDIVEITKVSSLRNTLECFKEKYQKHGVTEIWDNIIAVVVQPGVEFGDDTIIEYNRDLAKELVDSLKQNSNIVFEGHSTDYQTRYKLKQMVEDGIAILKVGPGLTFAFREALYSLALMESVIYNTELETTSGLIQVFETQMNEVPNNWKNYYSGSDRELFIARSYSFSDRIRYYIPNQNVQNAIEKLLKNLSAVDIPLSLISQYAPVQYNNIRKGKIEKNAEAILIDRIDNVLDDYIFAIGG